MFDNDDVLISIHTLALRVTEKDARGGTRYTISIHTLALRVTAEAQKQRDWQENFNPHPRTEGDFESAAYVARYILFQSTPSH